MRKFLFEYSFGGADWGITIHADDAAQAREKIKRVTFARYKGEVTAIVPVPGGGIIARLLDWLK